MLGLGLAIALAMVHLFAGRALWLNGVPQRLWGSLAGGISISYIFLDILPELSHAQIELEESGVAIVLYLERHVYLLSLVGLALFYGLEKLAMRSRNRNKATTGEHVTELAVFWTHVGFFAVYNALLGYLFRESAVHGITDCLILFVALGLHFVVNDVGLRKHHKTAYERAGRWILAGAIVTGWVIGQASEVNEAAIATIWALVAGSLILNVLKEELPESHESHFGWFLVGTGVYSAILLLT